MLTADFVYLNLWKWTMTISTGCTVRGSGVHKMQFKGIYDCWLVDTVCQCANILWAEKLIKALCLICAWRAADVASTPTKLDTWVSWRWAHVSSVWQTLLYPSVTLDDLWTWLGLCPTETMQDSDTSSFLELTEAQRCRMMNRGSAEASEWHYF